jgi:hypothetical protein
MPRRQFARLSIVDLEKLFDEKRGNNDVLTSLFAELSHRTVPRAKNLRHRVLQALSVAKKPALSKRGSKAVNSDHSQFLLTLEEHKRIAARLRQGDPEWDQAERAKALELAEHHEFLAKLIERRQQQT